MRGSRHTDSSDDGDGETLEGTLALIKPDAVHKSKDILKRINEEGIFSRRKTKNEFFKVTF